MSRSRILRLGGVVAAVAGLWTAATAFLSFEATPEWVYFVGTVLTVFALFTIYAALVELGGTVGLLGFALASAGNLMFLGEAVFGEMAFTVGGAVFALGLVLLGITNLRSRVFSPLVGWLWIASVALGLPGFALPSLMAAFFAAGGLTLGVGFALAGVELWQRLPATPSPA